MNIKMGLLILAAALSVSACSTSRSMLGLGDSPAPARQATIQTNNPLALPPDLSLRKPGDTTATYQANQSTAAALPPADGAEGDVLVSAAPVAPAAPRKDVYAEYGISKTKPDGTPKDATELQKELKAAVRKRKQQENPNYGTIFNMGKVFEDG